MKRHLISNLLLIGLSLTICSVLYPAVLLGIGQLLLFDKANGSLEVDKAGKVTGSRLLAQSFSGDEYFQPRPSAVGYNAAATGGSNLGPNNPALRKRVIGSLGTLLKFLDGKPVGPEVLNWVHENLDRDRTVLKQWIEADSNLAERWGAANAEFLKNWEKDHTDASANWRNENPGVPDVPPAILAGLYFDDYLKNAQVTLPETDGKDIQGAFFELWWKEHPNSEFEPVPSDLVMTSGCGLDPHITLKGANYQLDRVAHEWAARTNREVTQIKSEIASILKEQSLSPLGGLAGVELVNVFELNLKLKERYGD